MAHHLPRGSLHVGPRETLCRFSSDCRWAGFGWNFRAISGFL
jgi:hypothetical protein